VNYYVDVSVSNQYEEILLTKNQGHILGSLDRQPLNVAQQIHLPTTQSCLYF